MALNPLTVRKLRRFRSIKRGYWSFVVLMALIVVSLFGELLVNNRALLVRYHGHWYLPTYGANLPGTTFGLEYTYDTDYRDLQRRFQEENRGDRVLLPLVPYGP
ncbi:MAG: ABC transporter permease, partial [Opitutales bacterium]